MALLDLFNPVGFYTAVANSTGIGPAVFKANLNQEDIEAIKGYFDVTPAKTPEAQNIANQFRSWYQRLSTINAYTDTAYAEAKKYRDDFNLANATTKTEKAAVANVQATSIPREQMYGLEKDQASILDKVQSIIKWTGVGIVGVGVGYITFKISRILF